MPRGLFGRSLIIIIAPMVLLQAIVSYVFFERDLDTTTRRMARDVAADTAFLIALEDTYPDKERDRDAGAGRASTALRIDASSAAPTSRRRRSAIARAPSTSALDEVIAQQIGESRHFKVRSRPQDLRHPRGGA